MSITRVNQPALRPQLVRNDDQSKATLKAAKQIADSADSAWKSGDRNVAESQTASAVDTFKRSADQALTEKQAHNVQNEAKKYAHSAYLNGDRADGDALNHAEWYAFNERETLRQKHWYNPLSW